MRPLTKAEPLGLMTGLTNTRQIAESQAPLARVASPRPFQPGAMLLAFDLLPDALDLVDGFARLSPPVRAKIVALVGVIADQN